jgi:amidase
LKSTNELAFLPAVALAAKIRAGDIGCVELLDYFIARQQKFHSLINAVIWTDFDRARARAKEADRAPAEHRKLGPLHGVPMTVKECFALEGSPATFGVSKLRHNIAGQNALAVDRLLQAGANIFGKTNVPPWLMDGQSDNEIYGRTNNPWDITRTPGGSSGGAAAAVAAGISGVELGTDIASSIRNPAHYCGVFGHKPTWGICPKIGASHDNAIAEPDIDVLGPLARSADDLEAVLSIVAGPDEVDGVGYKLALPPSPARELREFRVALITNDAFAEVDHEISRELERLGEFLAREGVQIAYDARPQIESSELFGVFMTMVRAATSTRLTDEEFAHAAERARQADMSAADMATFALRGNTISHREWHLLHEARHRYRRRWQEFFKSYDVVLCPPFATAAPPHSKEPVSNRRVAINGKPHLLSSQLFWAGFAGLPLLPASVAPIGLTADGLPVGVQIIGAPYRDLSCIHFARLLERHYRAFVPPPGF